MPTVPVPSITTADVFQALPDLISRDPAAPLLGPNCRALPFHLIPRTFIDYRGHTPSPDSQLAEISISTLLDHQDAAHSSRSEPGTIRGNTAPSIPAHENPSADRHDALPAVSPTPSHSVLEERIGIPNQRPGTVEVQGSSTFRNVRLRLLGNQVEGIYSPLGWHSGGKSGSRTKPRSTSATTPEQRAANRARADSRARSQVRRLVIAYDLRSMWTLTFRDEVTNLEAAWKAFTNFIRRARRRWGSFEYVAVAAVQRVRSQRAGVAIWHFHVAVAESQTHDEVAELWANGSVRCSAPRDAHRVAGYLRRNMEEASDDRVCGRRYRAARGMKIVSVDRTVASEAQFLHLIEAAG
jgi:hypothetical protein